MHYDDVRHQKGLAKFNCHQDILQRQASTVAVL
jgi:hypothetical protein